MSPVSRASSRLAAGLLLASLAAGSPVHAASGCASLRAESGYIPKDFTILEAGGMYHAFYIRHPFLAPGTLGEVDFGHAVSANLYDWTYRSPVIHARPGMWDDSLVWAPHVIERSGVYYLFYTGVSYRGGSQRFQRLGVATSTNLDDWSRLDVPVVSCTDVPWSFCDSTDFAAGDCRDPFVMPDPTRSGSYLMYYSTRPDSVPTSMVVGVARSDGDLAEWSDVGPLWNTENAATNSEKIESPHLFSHDGLWYLFYTTNAGHPLSYQVSTDPLAGPSGWAPQQRLYGMLGNDASTDTWVASEVFRDALHEYFAIFTWSTAPQEIQIRQIAWRPTKGFDLIEPQMVRSLAWSRTRAEQGDTVTLAISTRGLAGRKLPLQGYTLDGGGGEVAQSAAALGLPDSVLIGGSCVTLTWWAQNPDPLHSDGQVRVRVGDWPITSPDLTVHRPTGSGGGGGGRRMIDASMTATRPAPPPLRLRWVADAPVGPGAGALVELERAARVRVDLLDVAGRRVRQLADRELPAGATLIPWDGRGDDGRRPAPGVYLVSARAGGGRAVARMTVLPR